MGHGCRNSESPFTSGGLPLTFRHFVGNPLNNPKFTILCQNTYLTYTNTIYTLNIIISSRNSLIQVIRSTLCTYFTSTSKRRKKKD